VRRRAASAGDGSGGGGEGEGGGELKLSATAMVQLGRQCKELLDAGRAGFVRDTLRLQAHAALYCAEETSAENHLLLASPLVHIL
jgi:hypothetical protein